MEVRIAITSFNAMYPTSPELDLSPPAVTVPSFSPIHFQSAYLCVKASGICTTFLRLILGQIHSIIGSENYKMRKEIRELPRTGVFSLLYYCIQEDILG